MVHKVVYSCSFQEIQYMQFQIWTFLWSSLYFTVSLLTSSSWSVRGIIRMKFKHQAHFDSKNEFRRNHKRHVTKYFFFQNLGDTKKCFVCCQYNGCNAVPHHHLFSKSSDETGFEFLNSKAVRCLSSKWNAVLMISLQLMVWMM